MGLHLKLTNIMIDDILPTTLGSTSWEGAGGYEASGELHHRATTFFAAVRWDSLLALSSKHRDGIPCSFGEKFSIGHFNMVRRIVFADGVSWVARLRLPRLASLGGLEALDDASTFKAEIASMKFFKYVVFENAWDLCRPCASVRRVKTSIPVPEVYSYSVDTENYVGAPYILMDYIHGTVATELRVAKNCDVDLFGTLQQDRKFRQQMAGIQVALSLFEFDQIGSLYEDEVTSKFFIGPDVETGRGPWASPMDYYTDLANHELQSCVAHAPADVQTSWSFAIPVLLKHLISVYGHNSTSNDLFKLTNRDFGAHNLLVNNDFEIVGVIDLDGVIAAPIEVVSQYPQLSGLDRVPPGHIENRPLAIDRISRTAPKLAEYQSFVEKPKSNLGLMRTENPQLRL